MALYANLRAGPSDYLRSPEKFIGTFYPRDILKQFSIHAEIMLVPAQKEGEAFVDLF